MQKGSKSWGCLQALPALPPTGHTCGARSQNFKVWVPVLTYQQVTLWDLSFLICKMGIMVPAMQSSL